MTAPYKIFFLVFIMMTGLLISPAHADEEASPSMELLEFLGEWESDNGVFVDPAELNKLNIPEQERKKDAN